MPQCPKSLTRLVVILATALLLVNLSADAQNRRKRARTPQRTVESVKKDKSNTERRISETATRLQTNAKELNSQINRLNSLNADIEANRSKVAGLRSHIDSLGSAINVTADSIRTLEGDLESMRMSYVKALRGLQPHAGMAGDLSFIFSAESFSEAYSRIRYLRRFSEWRERKAERIREGIEQIAERRAHLTSLRHRQDQAFRKAEEVQQTLSKQQVQSAEMVTKLRKEDSALKRSLNEQKKKAAALDRELDRLIAAEQARLAREEEARRKAAEAKAKAAKSKGAPTASGSTKDAGERSAKDVASAGARTQTAAATAASALSGSFEANKGRLLFPVAGKYKIVRRFGRQPHPTLPHVETDNSGIDIEVGAGSSARAIFAGKVSAIFKQDGFNSIVMIRHGRYISIYAGLASVGVKQGDSVKAGQALGRIFSDPDDGNRTILHFEIRNERQKLNPVSWVK